MMPVEVHAGKPGVQHRSARDSGPYRGRHLVEPLIRPPMPQIQDVESRLPQGANLSDWIPAATLIFARHAPARHHVGRDGATSSSGISWGPSTPCACLLGAAADARRLHLTLVPRSVQGVLGQRPHEHAPSSAAGNPSCAEHRRCTPRHRRRPHLSLLTRRQHGHTMPTPMPGNSTDCHQLRGSNTAVPGGATIHNHTIGCPLTPPLTASIVPKLTAILIPVPRNLFVRSLGKRIGRFGRNTSKK
jgi:hypothetical protein